MSDSTAWRAFQTAGRADDADDADGAGAAGVRAASAGAGMWAEACADAGR
jgi:hypothetical protein